MQVIAADRPDLSPFSMPDRFRTEVAYFATPGQPGVSKDEHWIRLEDATRWLDELVFDGLQSDDAALLRDGRGGLQYVPPGGQLVCAL